MTHFQARTLTPRAPETAAIVNGARIPLKELDDSIRPQLKELDARVYQIRKMALETLIDEKLFRLEAERRGLSAMEYLNELVNGKPITGSEVEAMYRQMQGRLSGIPAAAAKEQIHRDLIEARRRAVYLERVQDLRRMAQIIIALDRPTAPKLHVELTGQEPAVGDSRARVSIIEFSDFQCPFCKALQQSLARVLAAHQKEVRLVFKHFPLPSHETAQIAAEAAVCANRQQRPLGGDK